MKATNQMPDGGRSMNANTLRVRALQTKKLKNIWKLKTLNSIFLIESEGG